MRAAGKVKNCKFYVRTNSYASASSHSFLLSFIVNDGRQPPPSDLHLPRNVFERFHPSLRCTYQ